MQTSWAKDWAICGGCSGLLAPVGMGLPLVEPAYCLLTCAIGAVSGAALGPAVLAALTRLRSRWSPPLWTLGLALGGVWGATVGGLAGALVDHGTPLEVAALGAAFGAISGAVQLTWFLPAYVWARLRDQPGSVLTLAGLLAVGLPWMGLLALLVLFMPFGFIWSAVG